MKLLKRFLLVLLAFVGLVVVAFFWLINSAPDMSEFEGLYAKPASSKVTVQFFGTSSMMFSDGETNILIDGWFTRPTDASMAFGTVTPDEAAISYGLEKLGNPQVAAIIPVHSHFDHAMDVASVALLTGAQVVGSAATASIARGGDLPEDQVVTVQDGQILQYGAFKITMIESIHYVPANPVFAATILEKPEITAPLSPPAAALDYRLGKAYSILLEHPSGSALIQGSANQKPGSLAGRKVDVVYLGVGGVAGQTPDYQNDYWREIVTRTEAKGIYIIHWDSFSAPLSSLGNRPAPPNSLLNSLLGFRADDGIRFAAERADQAGISSALLPMWEKADAFSVSRDK